MDTTYTVIPVVRNERWRYGVSYKPTSSTPTVGTVPPYHSFRLLQTLYVFVTNRISQSISQYGHAYKRFMNSACNMYCYKDDIIMQLVLLLFSFSSNAPKVSCNIQKRGTKIKVRHRQLDPADLPNLANSCVHQK